MSQLKKFALKTGVIALVLWGGYKWINQTPEYAAGAAVAADQVVGQTLDKSDIMLDQSSEWVGAKAAIVGDAWDRIDVKGKVSSAQDSVKPIGKMIKRKVDPNNIPGVKEAGWMDGKTSFPAMLLLLIAGVMLSLIAIASPSSISGGRH